MSRLSLLDSTGYAAFQGAETNFIDVYAQVDAIVAGNVSFSKITKTQADSPYTVTSANLAGPFCINNTGATGELVCNLPAGVATNRIAFYVAAAQNLKVVANGTETIRFLGEQSAGGGYAQSNTVGTFWILEWNNSEWIITGLIGALEHAAGVFGELYRWQYVDAGAMLAPSTGGAASGTKHGTNRSFDYFAFDGGAAEEKAFFKLVAPPGWDRSTIKAVVLWSPGAGTCSENDDITWAVGAGAIGDDDAWDAALGTYRGVEDQVTAGKDADLHITAATPAITVGGTPALGDEITFGVLRDTDGSLETTGDDMAEDGWARGMYIGWKLTKTIASL